MKKITLATLMLIVCACCRTNKQNIVKVEYLHEYGVPVSESDWTKQGQNGKVVSLTKDGNTITQTYHEGCLHGETTTTFAHSSIIEKKEVYEGGTLLSVTEHYVSGVPKKMAKYEQSDIKEIITWYNKGTPKSIEQLELGRIVQGEYRTTNNDLESTITQGHGVRPKRSDSGMLLGKENIENGVVVEEITFYPNLEPQCVTPYHNNLIHGNRLTFLPGGIPQTNEEWTHGVQEGTTVEYTNGIKSAEVPYHNGVKEGIALYFNEDQELVEKVTWKNNKKHGPRILLINEDQNKVEYYLDGELVSRPTYERLSPLR